MTESTLPDWLSMLTMLSEAELLAMAPQQASQEEAEARFPEILDVIMTPIDIPGQDGQVVKARSYRVGDAPARAGLLWVHGGGFVFGNLDMPEADWVGRMLAARGIPVLSVDYRMCLRGIHFPAPSDDVLSAWRWLRESSEDVLGVRVEGLHLGGASAGGNLVAGVSKRLRDGEEPRPCSLLLVYPLVHPELPDPSEELAALIPDGAWLSPQTVKDMTLNFAGSVAGLLDPYAFAANGDVSDQGPVLILNSEADPLRSSGEAYGAQLAEAGVDVTVLMEPGTEHGHLSEQLHPGGLASVERIAQWINDHGPTIEQTRN